MGMNPGLGGYWSVTVRRTIREADYTIRISTIGEKSRTGISGLQIDTLAMTM